MSPKSKSDKSAGVAQSMKALLSTAGTPSAKLVRDIISSVERLNAMARKNPELQEVAKGLSRWPALIGREPKYDNFEMRQFAEKHLGEPLFKLVGQRNNDADWAEKPAQEILRYLYKWHLEENDPSGIS